MTRFGWKSDIVASCQVSTFQGKHQPMTKISLCQKIPFFTKVTTVSAQITYFIEMLVYKQFEWSSINLDRRTTGLLENFWRRTGLLQILVSTPVFKRPMSKRPVSKRPVSKRPMSRVQFSIISIVQNVSSVVTSCPKDQLF